MDEIEKYSYFYKGRKILIETGKKRDSTGEIADNRMDRTSLQLRKVRIGE